jgi:CRISPR-associated protein (TIGR03984 family)
VNPIRKRSLRSCPAVGLPVSVPETVGDVGAWLQEQAAAHRLTLLLAHADDGVIWGRVEDGRLLTSHGAAQGHPEAVRACPPLRAETLQQARLFADHAELLLWRADASSWRCRLIRDICAGERGQWEEGFDEAQILWGTHGFPLAQDFTLLRDGAQGLRHAVPVPLPLSGPHYEATPPRLWVRHYLGPDDCACIVASRLFDLRSVE